MRTSNKSRIALGYRRNKVRPRWSTNW